MLLTGTFHRSLDEKSRFALPKRLRDALGHPGRNHNLYVAPGTDGSLGLYSEEALSRLAEQLAQGSPNGQDNRTFSRLFYAQAQSVELDRLGRIRIPPELLELARISKEIVLLGVRDHLEVWDKARWGEYLNQKLPRYDEIAENAFLPPGAPVPAPARAAMPDHEPTDYERPVLPR